MLGGFLVWINDLTGLLLKLTLICLSEASRGLPTYTSDGGPLALIKTTHPFVSLSSATFYSGE